MDRIHTPHFLMALIALVTMSPLSPVRAGGAPLVVNVPGDVATIQAGIDLVAEGGEVIVAIGTYAEALDLNGKALTLRSSDPTDPLVVAATMLVGPPGNANVVTCSQGEGPDTVLDGLTIADATSFVGAGLLISDSSPRVIRCTFRGNTALLGGGANAANSLAVFRECTFESNTSGSRGGGLYTQDSEVQVIGCTFRDNTSEAGAGMFSLTSDSLVRNTVFIENQALRTISLAATGGGMANEDSQLTIVNCLFAGNLAEGSGFGGGGGIYNRDSDVILANSTFVGNSGDFIGDAGGMYSRGDSQQDVDNCIFRGNGPVEIIDAFGADTGVSWSDVQGGWPGFGNVDVDPLFVDAAGDDYRLSAGSPCIDAGDTYAVPGGARRDLDWNPRYVPDPDTPDTGLGARRVVDMGAYEFQPPVTAGGGPLSRSAP